MGSTVAEWRAGATYAAGLLEIRRLQGRLDELLPLVDELLADPDGLPAWRAAAALVLVGERPSDARGLLGETVSDLDTLLPFDFSRGAALLCLARAVIALGATEYAPPLLARLRPWAGLMSWQGTTTYGPYGTAVAGLGALLGDDEAVDAGRAGVDRATARLGSPVYRST